VLKRAIVVPLAALLLLAAASADAGWQGSASAGATAQAQAIRVVVPNGPGGATPAVSAPDDHVAFSGGFTYEDPSTHAAASDDRLGECECFRVDRRRGERDRFRRSEQPQRLQRRDHRHEHRRAGRTPARARAPRRATRQAPP
jgi:hypothetical protein